MIPKAITLPNGIRALDVRHLFPNDQIWTNSPRTIIGTAIHHDGVLFAPGDRNFSGRTTDEDLQRLHAIYNHAIAHGWKRFPYHFVASPNARLYYTLDIDQQGSHVADRNSALRGVALMGDFSHVDPTPDLICTAAGGVTAIWGHIQHAVPTRPHYEWALPGPHHATSCPGPHWPRWGGTLIAAAAARLNAA